MFSLWRALARVFNWRYYHRSTLFSQDPQLEKEWKRIKGIKNEGPYSLQPLLLGTIQAADFVLKWAEPQEKELSELDNISRIGLSDEEEGRLEAERLKKEHSHKWFRKKKRLFEALILQESVNLQVELNIISDIRRLRIISVILLVLIVILILPLTLVFYTKNNPLAQLSDLAFASILLVPFIFGLFTYSQIVRADYNRRRDVEIKLTRASAASHAYNTLEQIEVIPEQLDAKTQKKLEMDKELSRLEIENQSKALSELDALITKWEFERINQILYFAREQKLSNTFVEESVRTIITQRSLKELLVFSSQVNIPDAVQRELIRTVISKQTEKEEQSNEEEDEDWNPNL